MRIIRNSFIVLTCVLIIMLAFLSIVQQILFTTIIKPYNTEHYLEDSGIYGAIEQETEKILLADIESNSDNYDDFLSAALKTVVKSLITEERIALISNEAQTVFWDYMTSKSDSVLNISIFEDIYNVSGSIENDVGGMSDNDVFFSAVKNELLNLLERNKSTIMKANQYIDNKAEYYLGDIKLYYQTIERIKPYIYVLIGILFCVVILLSKESKNFLNAISHILTTLGILLGFFLLLVKIVGNGFLNARLESIDIPATIEASIANLIGVTVNDFFDSMIMPTLIFLSTGILLLIVNRIFAKSNSGYKGSEV